MIVINRTTIQTCLYRFIQKDTAKLMETADILSLVVKQEIDGGYGDEGGTVTTIVPSVTHATVVPSEAGDNLSPK